MLSFEEVDSLLSYNSETGILRWKVPRKGTKGVGSEAGCMNKKTGYIIIGLHGKIYYAHRIAHLLMTGFWPYMDPDHENRIRHDNRWENIRDLATKHESMGNQGLRGNNTSGLKGVSWYRSSQKWRVRIAIHWKHIHLGYFDDLRLAGLTYDAAAKLAWGLRFSCLNFPPEESDHIVLPSRKNWDIMRTMSIIESIARTFFWLTASGAALAVIMTMHGGGLSVILR